MANNCRGMTLIEVLVAFVVLSVTMAVILQIFTGGFRNARLADSYTRAVLLAESKLAATGVEQPLVTRDTSGKTAEMQWQIGVHPFEDGGATDRFLLPIRLYQITVRVAWSEDSHNRQVILHSMRLGPSQ